MIVNSALAAIAYLPTVDSCAPVIQPTSIKGYWACLVRRIAYLVAHPSSARPQVAFDVLALVVIIMNSFHRPYTHHQDVVSSLRRDGAVWFVVRALPRASLLPNSELTAAHLSDHRV